MLLSAAARIPPSSSTLLRPHVPISLPSSCNIGVARRLDDILRLARWRCHAISEPSTPEYGANLAHNGVSVSRWPEKVAKLNDEDQVPEDMVGMINGVKSMLSSTDDDGEISISAYDTAWVALVKHQNGSGDPQFPSSLQWIIENQLPDGSWGDSIFLAHDRIISTLACVVALKSWNTHPDICDRGISFLRDNMWRLAQQEGELVLTGFEIAFPALLERAKALGLELPYDDPALQDIYARRNLKLKRIPSDVLHKLPTTLLYSLEGLPGLDWEKLFGLQCVDGSFQTSPASTAYALMQTNDEKCLKYLQKIVERFDGGVPNLYPVDLFDRLWAVDRLERLGISRYFEPETKQCLDFVYRYWTEEGIGWTRYSTVNDVDDTSMGFRLLRLHGYHVSPDVFRHFEKEGSFFCFAGQSSQAAVSEMYNLNRASQVAFPGEKILEQAKDFSCRFLREKQASNQFLDRWIITKDLPGEVEYALDFPWYASLPRIEARLYIEHYGGADVVWIGKALYRMPRVNNDVYLELAKSDFNRCQAHHQVEWEGLQKWCEESGLAKQGVRAGGALTAYFLAAACIFEPDRAAERLAWARTAIVADAISSYFRSESCSDEMRQAFIHDFLDGGRNDQSPTTLGWKRSGLRGEEEVAGPVLLQLLDRIASDALSTNRGNHVGHHLRGAWVEWLLTWKYEDEGTHVREETGLLLVRTVEICAGRSGSVEPATARSEFDWLARLTSSVCHRLQRRLLLQQGTRKNLATFEEDKAVEAEMRELVQCVLQRSPSLSSQTKQTFLTVTKSFYYAAHCPSAVLNHHISKVLFEPIAQSGCK